MNGKQDGLDIDSKIRRLQAFRNSFLTDASEYYETGSGNYFYLIKNTEKVKKT